MVVSNKKNIIDYQQIINKITIANMGVIQWSLALMTEYNRRQKLYIVVVSN